MAEKLVLGIDEAGRGPVVGSLFVCGALVNEKNEYKLKKLGVKDSKLLTEDEREFMASELPKILEDFVVKEITASQIDKLMKSINLNVIEMQIFAKVIEELKPNKVIIDLPEKNGEKFVLKVKKFLDPKIYEKIEFIAENKADENYPVVSAASILAKSAREKHVKKLYEKYGYFRTGYPHDEDTIKMLEEYVKKYKKLPPDARKCWSTSKKILEKFAQKKLGEF